MTQPTYSARATPLGRAAAAIEARIRRSVHVELRPGMIGQPFAATMPELAHNAVSAALDVEEMAQALHDDACIRGGCGGLHDHGAAMQEPYRARARAIRTAILGAGA